MHIPATMNTMISINKVGRTHLLCVFFRLMILWMLYDVVVAIVTNNGTIVPLIPFTIWIEWTISSPDVLYIAVTDYLVQETLAQAIYLEEIVSSNRTINDFNSTVPIDFSYTGTATLLTDYGNMSQLIFQQEQQMALRQIDVVERFVQLYFDNVTHPYNSSIQINKIELQMSHDSIDDERPTPMIEHSDDRTTSNHLDWFQISLIGAGVACIVCLIVFMIGIVFTMIRRRESQIMKDWKYIYERERYLLQHDPTIPTNSNSHDTMDETHHHHNNNCDSSVHDG